MQQLLHQLLRGRRVQRLAHLAQIHRQQEQRRQLAGERLGRRHADLRPACVISVPGGLARDHGADHVADGQRLRALLLGLALRRQRVGGFAGLRNHHRQRVVADDRIAIAELAAVIHFHRNARQLLDHELAGQRRVPAGSAGDDAHLAELLELAWRRCPSRPGKCGRIPGPRGPAWCRARRAAAHRFP